jgi:hypothetical protein
MLVIRFTASIFLINLLVALGANANEPVCPGSTAYQPGKDINGKPVIPADLYFPSTQIANNTLSLQLFSRPQAAESSAGTNIYGEIPVGQVTITPHEPSTLRWNGAVLPSGPADLPPCPQAIVR